MSTIFFDLDGTLTDPREGIVKCVQHALREMGERVPGEDDLLWFIGPPLQDSFPRQLGGAERAEEAIRLYRERFATVGMYENTPYDGIAEVLGKVKAKGHRLFVATSKAQVFARKIIAHFELDRYFDEVFGAELNGVRANKTDLLAYALEQTGTDPAQALMIGDREHDIIGARNNGLRTLGVLYGYGSENELKGAGADAIVETPGDIALWVNRWG